MFREKNKICWEILIEDIFETVNIVLDVFTIPGEDGESFWSLSLSQFDRLVRAYQFKSKEISLIASSMVVLETLLEFGAGSAAV